MSLSIDNTYVRPSCQPARPSLRVRIGNFFAIARQRRQLATLDPHILCDIGVTQAQATAESRKSLWNAPNHWQL